MLRRAIALGAPAAAVLVAACATLGTKAGEETGLPSAGVGPFRRLGSDELAGVAPFVLDDRLSRYREPSVLPATDDATKPDVVLFAVAERGGTTVIVRTHATDGRSFFGGAGDAAGRTAPVVLAPELPWEGGALSGPSALRSGDQVLLYYAGAGGIGLARSTAGGAFVREAAPVLAVEGAHAPSVVRLPEGGFRMLYVVGTSIYEAESQDGRIFVPRDADRSTPALDPLLGPSPPRTLEPGEKPPFDLEGVGDPEVALRTTVAGRLHFRVLYTGFGRSVDTGAPVTAVGFAARYGTDGPLVRNAFPTIATGKGEAQPALFEWAPPEGPRSLLYFATQKGTGDATYPAIGAGLGPATAELGLPGEFPDGP
jgi:hypothetical protein